MRAYNHNVSPGFVPAMAAFLNWGTGKTIPCTLQFDPANPSRCQTIYATDETATGGGTLTIWAAGAQAFSVSCNVPPLGVTEGPSLELKAGIPPFPSRAEACSIRVHFQGGYVNSRSFSAAYQSIYGGNGQIPYFGAAFADFVQGGDDPRDLIGQLVAMGDTHAMVYLSHGGPGYNEAGQPYGANQLIPQADCWGNFALYLRCVDAIIASGLKPVFVMDGEGSPDWLLANFRDYVSRMRVGYDRLAYGPVIVAFDGVWPDGAGWTPSTMHAVIPWMRSVLGLSGYLGFFYGNGPVGNPYLWVDGESDYTEPWCDGLDIVLTTSGITEAGGVSMANKSAYMVRDPNFSEFQPSYPHGFVMHDCSRGPRYWGNIEWNTYGTVRDPLQLLKPQIDAQRALMQRMNVPCWG